MYEKINPRACFLFHAHAFAAQGQPSIVEREASLVRHSFVL